MSVVLGFFKGPCIADGADVALTSLFGVVDRCFSLPPNLYLAGRQAHKWGLQPRDDLKYLSDLAQPRLGYCYCSKWLAIGKSTSRHFSRDRLKGLRYLG